MRSSRATPPQTVITINIFSLGYVMCTVRKQTEEETHGETRWKTHEMNMAVKVRVLESRGRGDRQERREDSRDGLNTQHFWSLQIRHQSQ